MRRNWSKWRFHIEPRLHVRYRKRHRFCTVYNWVQGSPMIKGVTHRNCDVDGICKWGLDSTYYFCTFNSNLSSWYGNRRDFLTDTPEWDRSANILPRYGATSWSKTCLSLTFKPNTGNVSSVVCQPCSCSHSTLMQKSSSRKSRSPSYATAIFCNDKVIHVSCNDDTLIYLVNVCLHVTFLARVNYSQRHHWHNAEQ